MKTAAQAEQKRLILKFALMEMGMENYQGFQIIWAEPPISLAMWALEIGTDDDNLRNKLLKYRDQHGMFATPVGPLEQALVAAHEYIDAVLAESDAE